MNEDEAELTACVYRFAVCIDFSRFSVRFRVGTEEKQSYTTLSVCIRKCVQVFG